MEECPPCQTAALLLGHFPQVEALANNRPSGPRTTRDTIAGMNERRTRHWTCVIGILVAWVASACAITLAGYHAASEWRWILPSSVVQFILSLWLASLLFVRVVFKALETMTPDRKKPDVARWGTVALVVALVGYLSSFVPGTEDIIISSLGVAFVAFVIWLTVRIVNMRREVGQTDWRDTGRVTGTLSLSIGPALLVVIEALDSPRKGRNVD